MNIIIILAFVWIISKIARKAQAALVRKKALANAAKLDYELQKAREAAQGEKERQKMQKAREAQAKKEAAEAEKKRKAEAAQAAARTTIEHYYPMRDALIKELLKLENEPPHGKSQERIEKQKMTLSEKIYQIDRKLEKAEFTLYA